MYIIQPWITLSFSPLTQHVCCLTALDKSRKDAGNPEKTREPGHDGPSVCVKMQFPAVSAAYNTADEARDFFQMHLNHTRPRCTSAPLTAVMHTSASREFKSRPKHTSVHMSVAAQGTKVSVGARKVGWQGTCRFARHLMGRPFGGPWAGQWLSGCPPEKPTRVEPKMRNKLISNESMAREDHLHVTTMCNLEQAVPW